MESFSVKFSGDEIVPQSDLRVGTALRKHLPNGNHTKVLIWNTKNYTVQAIRAKLNIGKNLIMRQRGKYSTKRIEVWCQSNAEAKSILSNIKNEAKRNKFHVSLGSTFKDRELKQKINIYEENADTLKILQWNSRSLRNKMELLKQEIQDKKPSIICIQESFKIDDILKFYKFADYKIFNLSREDKGGGGVVTMIHNSIHVIESKQQIKNQIECINTKLLLQNNISLSLVNVYIYLQA